jgi:putative intracellular protease/amidase
MARILIVLSGSDDWTLSDGTRHPTGYWAEEFVDPSCDPLGAIIMTLYDEGRIVAAVCHGPAGLLSARRAEGSWLFAGRRLTAFTNTNKEERQGGLADRTG